MLYALLGAESYQLFVTDRGWSVDDWHEWVHGALALELLGRVPDH